MKDIPTSAKPKKIPESAGTIQWAPELDLIDNLKVGQG